MKQSAAALVMAGTFAAAIAFGPVAARAACSTEGAFALAFAQEIGRETNSQAEAAAYLSALGIAPGAGWDIDACLTEVSALQIHEAVGAAIAAGRVAAKAAEIAYAVALDLSRSGAVVRIVLRDTGNLAHSSVRGGGPAGEPAPGTSPKPRAGEPKAPPETPPALDPNPPDDKPRPPPVVPRPPDDKPASPFIP